MSEVRDSDRRYLWRCWREAGSAGAKAPHCSVLERFVIPDVSKLNSVYSIIYPA